ncbi:MAG: hypothetical protein AB1714_24205 [Acidobacteriota bacterium]
MTTTVELWGRSTNQVMAMCTKHGAAPLTVEERSGFVIVTFKAQMVLGERPDCEAHGEKETRGKSRENSGEKTVEKE